MKTKTVELIKVIANLITWVFTGVNYRRRAKRCAAYKRGWCKGERCNYCNPMSEKEADELLPRIQIETKNKENEI